MKVTVIDAWESEGNITMKYKASITGRPDSEGVISLPSAASEMEFLEQAMPVIRSRVTSSGPAVQGLLNLAKTGKPIDDNLDPAPAAAPTTTTKTTK